MKQILFLAVFIAVVLQSSAAQISDTASPRPACRPQRFCLSSYFCRYGTEPAYDSRGCPACPKCAPKCGILMCPAIFCENPKPTVQDNGCPGCPDCSIEPACEPLYCPATFCENPKPTVLENGCPGCGDCSSSYSIE